MAYFKRVENEAYPLEKRVTPNSGKPLMYPFLAEAGYCPPESPLSPSRIVVGPECLSGHTAAQRKMTVPQFPWQSDAATRLSAHQQGEGK